MVNPEDVEKLEEQIMKVSQSTRSSIPLLAPLHDWLRRKYDWYYAWHTKKAAVRLHVIILIILLVIAAYYFLRITADTIKLTQ